jgi:hypothetical protein
MEGLSICQIARPDHPNLISFMLLSLCLSYMLWNGVLDLEAVELGDIVMADHPLVGLGTAREVTVDKLG